MVLIKNPNENLSKIDFIILNDNYASETCPSPHPKEVCTHLGKNKFWDKLPKFRGGGILNLKNLHACCHRIICILANYSSQGMLGK